MAFEQLQSLGIGVIGFAIIIGVGVIVLQNLGGSLGTCPSVGGNLSVWNSSAGNCGLTEGAVGSTTQNGTLIDPDGDAFTSLNYMETQLGTTGLAGWTPAIIALTVGMMFLGYFLTRKGGGY